MTAGAAPGSTETTDAELASVDAPRPTTDPPSPAGSATTTDAIEAANNRFLRLRDEGRKEEATAAALQVATLTQERPGLDSIEIITPLINLAVMQSKIGDMTAAEQNYRVAIGVIERLEGIFSPRLINPLSGLGHTYNRAGKYEQAIESFERALRLNNIQLGFTNFRQFGIHDGLTESYVGLREYEDATFYQRAQVEIHQRKFGKNSPQVVPSMYKLAEWYSRAGDLEASALTYRGADRILRDQESESSAQRAEAMLGLARLYERQGNRPAAASTLNRGLEIINSNPEPDRLTRAKVLVALGDLYMRDNKRVPALTQYELAWADLSARPDYAAERDEFFELPVRIAGGPFPTAMRKAYGSSAATLAEGYVVIRYTVDANGRAQDIAVMESEPGEMLEESLVKTYNRSRYRPRMADGVAVPTENLLSKHDFQYVSAAPEMRDDKKQSSKSRRGRIDYPGADEED